MATYDPTPLQRVRTNEDTLDEIRTQLLERIIENYREVVRALGEEVAETHGVDFPAAQTLVASLGLDAGRAIQTLAAAEARANGVPLIALATAMGRRSATPLNQKIGQRIKNAQLAQEQADATGEPQKVEVADGWEWTFTPAAADADAAADIEQPELPGFDSSSDEPEPKTARKSARELLELEAEFEQARRKK